MRSVIASAMLIPVGTDASEGAAVRSDKARKNFELACSYLEKAQQVSGDEKQALAWGRLALAFVTKARMAAGADVRVRGRPQVRQLAGA